MSETVAVPKTGVRAELEAGRPPERKLTFRGGGFEIQRRSFVSIAALVIIVALWQLATATGLVSPIFLPSPMRVLDALWDLTVTGDLWRHLSASLMRIGYGWTIGTIFGIAAGVLIGLFTMARAVGVPLVAAIYPIPKIALLPLLILWLGIGEPSKVATIALSVFFPTAIATFSGVDAVPRNLIRMAQSFNVPLWRIVWQVLLPGALSGMLAGFRISIAAALLVLVAAEMIGAQFGLGAFLILTGNMMQTDRLMAGVVVVSLVGLTLSMVVSLLERRLLRWR
jgi:ABC-type nitrate/sulfonate/bicarbonate transport system permease component